MNRQRPGGHRGAAGDRGSLKVNPSGDTNRCHGRFAADSHGHGAGDSQGSGYQCMPVSPGQMCCPRHKQRQYTAPPCVVCHRW
jgi:hypothetical protein